MNIANQYIFPDAEVRTTNMNDPAGLPRIELVCEVICQEQARAKVALLALDLEIAQAESAYRLMLIADECLKKGSDDLLLPLGFTPAHVADLRRNAGPSGGYPPYSLRNIQETLTFLRDSRRECLEGSRLPNDGR